MEFIAWIIEYQKLMYIVRTVYSLCGMYSVRVHVSEAF